MAIYYVNSNALGSNTGLSWDNAFTTLAAADLVDVAGDTIYVSHLHTETFTGSLTYSFIGSDTAVTKIICVNSVGNPTTPTILAETANIASTIDTNFNSGNIYVYGIVFNAGSTLQIRVSYFGGYFEKCKFYSGSGSVNSNVQLYGDYAEYRYCTFGSDSVTRTAQAVHSFIIFAKIYGGSYHNPNNLDTDFLTTWTNCNTEITSFDFSQLRSTKNIQNEFYNQGSGTLLVKNCKMPLNWTGSVCTNGWNGSGIHSWSQLYNSDSTDTNFRLETHRRAGRVFSETTITRNLGASDGTTKLSFRMVTTAKATREFLWLHSPEICIWNEKIGVPLTLVVETVTNNVTLKDNEAWLDLTYLGNMGNPLGITTTTNNSIISTPVNIPTSTETWVTTGLATPIRQKLSVTFTPQEKGFIQLKVMLAKPSTTVYVCPKASVT